MDIPKAIGRPPKVNYKIIIKLADAIQHNASIAEACRYSGISKDTFFRYMKDNEVFAEKMTIAKENQNKAVLSFLTIF
jgi:molybdenum-dependent DNA-binding transcriptional regulator ModE